MLPIRKSSPLSLVGREARPRYWWFKRVFSTIISYFSWECMPPKCVLCWPKQTNKKIINRAMKRHPWSVLVPPHYFYFELLSLMNIGHCMLFTPAFLSFSFSMFISTLYICLSPVLVHSLHSCRLWHFVASSSNDKDWAIATDTSIVFTCSPRLHTWDLNCLSSCC